MPIYNIEYKSEDEKRSAIIRKLEGHWTISKWSGQLIATRLDGIGHAKTLTKAQAIAREWTK